MDPLNDTLSRHGVLAADATSAPRRRKKGAEPTPVALTGPLWMLAKVGDRIRVEGDGDVEDGEYKIASINQAALTLAPKGVSIRVKSGSYDEPIYNHTVKAILQRDGKPFAGTQADVDALTKDRPFWESIQVGDKIRIEGEEDVDDGIHTVDGTDNDLFAGADANGISIEDGGYVYNRNVKAIVERDGKPYSGPGAEVVAPATVVSSEPLWKRLNIGDEIEITAFSGNSDGYDVTREAGTYLVADFDRREPPTGGLRIRVKDKPGNNRGWIKEDRVIRINGGRVSGSPVSTQEPAWKRAKVGDKVRVSEGGDHGAGEFEVLRIDSDRGSALRLAVKYRDYGHWWIRNDKVMAIVGEDSPASAPIRGNCLIHVDVPTILSNREKAEHKPVIVARSLSKIGTPEIFRELAWDGPSRFVHHEFVRIDGTDIQNWVETDATITGWRDGMGIIMLDPLTGAPVSAKPMTRLILGAFVIHIAAPVLMRNRKEGRNDPVIAVRQAHSNWATDVVFGRRVEWSGPSRMVHRPSTPIPGTDGRGVSFIETDAEITVYRDDAEPLVLRMPQRAVAA